MCNRHALSRQCGAVLCCDREGHACATDHAGSHALDRPDRVRTLRLGAHDRVILS